MLPERPQQAGGLLVEQAGQETLIYRAGSEPGGGAIHALNATARLIWDACDGGHNLAEIEAAVREAFEVPAGQDLAADVRRTLAEFQSKQLIQP